MIFLLRWYKDYLEVRNEAIEKRRELQYCESCETLKFQLAIANDEKKQLLNRLIEKPEVKEPEVDVSNIRPILPRHGASWNLRRQMLENEDRQKAKLLVQKRDDETKSTPLTVEEIEKELGVTS